MKYSYTFQDAMHFIYFRNQEFFYQCNDYLNLPVCSSNIIINLNNDYIEMPACISTSILVNNWSISGIEKLIAPIIITQRTELSTFNKAFLMANSLSNSNVYKIQLKNCYYYMGRGIILDINLQPLMLCTTKIKKDTLQSIEHICRINPIVFSNEDIVSKNIIKQIIPYFSSKLHTEIPRKIIIGDISNFFDYTTPINSTSPNEDLNQCLVDNIDEILSLVCP